MSQVIGVQSWRTKNASEQGCISLFRRIFSFFRDFNVVDGLEDMNFMSFSVPRQYLWFLIFVMLKNLGWLWRKTQFSKKASCSASDSGNSGKTHEESVFRGKHCIFLTVFEMDCFQCCLHTLSDLKFMSANGSTRRNPEKTEKSRKIEKRSLVHLHFPYFKFGHR